jgi:hypothetical protein
MTKPNKVYRVIAEHDNGKIKVVLQDFWRSRNAKGIDVEVYVNGKFRYGASKIFGPPDYTDKEKAIQAAYAHAKLVFARKISLKKLDWEK